MIAALLLAACALDPITGLEEVVFFPPDMTGPTCTPERQAVECGCSECLTWDPVPDSAGYQVERVTISSGTTYLFDLPRAFNADPITGEITTVQQMIWCPAESVPFPREATLYGIRVRAFKPGPIFGDWSDQVLYRAAPYWCGVGGEEQQCYVADPVVSR